MASIRKYYAMIEKVIRDFGISPHSCRGEKPGQWNLSKGSAQVWIDVWASEEKDFKGFLQIMAPVVQVPPNQKEAFYREILDISHGLSGVAMTAYGDWIYMKAIRELDGLDEKEAAAMFNRIGTYADEYDDLLKDKYWGPSVSFS